MERSYDLIVFGAYGLTGKLVCEFINKNYKGLRWSIAGKQLDCLEELKHKLKLSDEVGMFECNSDDVDRLKDVAGRSKVFLNLAGPYVDLGTNVIEACIEAGTHYCDVCAELPYIRKSIDRYHREAERKHLKIVHCCGFDSIPADIGVFAIVQEMLKRKCETKCVRLVLEDTKGVVSAGTLSSMIESFEMTSMLDIISLANPFFLNPRDEKSHNPVKPFQERPILSRTRDSYLSIDTRVVNRSNALFNWKYGQNFIFYERMKVKSFFMAFVYSAFYIIFQLLTLSTLTRKVLRLILPNSNSHIKQSTIESGFFRMKLIADGKDQSGRKVSMIANISAENGDPGYKQSAKMVTEAAVALACDGERLPKSYGVLTPAVAFEGVLQQRLMQKGIRFDIQA